MTEASGGTGRPEINGIETNGLVRMGRSVLRAAG